MSQFLRNFIPTLLYSIGNLVTTGSVAFENLVDMVEIFDPNQRLRKDRPLYVQVFIFVFRLIVCTVTIYYRT